MKNARIYKLKNANGDEWYQIQYRFLYVFWYWFSFLGIEERFSSYEEAKNYIIKERTKKEINLKKSIIVECVMIEEL